MAKGEIDLILELIVDANALIDLIKLELLLEISRLPGYRFHIVEEVYKEITWPEQKKILKTAVESRLILIESLVSLEELKLFAQLSSTLDSGEAASLAYAYFHKSFLLTDENNRAFMREVRKTITEKRIKRTPELLAEVVRLNVISLSEINRRIENLKNLASTSRDLNDVEHLRNVLERIKKFI